MAERAAAKSAALQPSAGYNPHAAAGADCRDSSHGARAAQARRLWAIIVLLTGALVALALLCAIRLAPQSTPVRLGSRTSLAAEPMGAKLLASSSDSHLFLYPKDRELDPTQADPDESDAPTSDEHSEHDQNPDAGDNHRFSRPDSDNRLPGELSGGRRRAQLLAGEPKPRPGSNNNPNSNPNNNNNNNRQPDDVCLTTGCVRAAAQLLENMDNRTDPCQDFYQFACGRWIENLVIPDERTSASVFLQTNWDLSVKLRALIERRPQREDPPIVGQMRNMYTSCMNLTDIERRGDEPLLAVLRDLGGWPVLGGSASTSSAPPSTRAGEGRRRRRQEMDEAPEAGRSQPPAQHWLDTLAKFRQRGFSHDMIIDLSVVPDVRQSRRYIIELDQSSLGLPDRSYYFNGLNDTTVAAYYNLMVESAAMLGAPRDTARRQMAEALEFETALARISLPREQRRNVTRMYNKMLAADLYKLAPNIDWRRYLTLLLRDDQLDMEHDEVVVKVPSFIRALDGLLAQTPARTIANYMMWRIVRHSMTGLSRRWRELAHSYSTVTTGRQIEEPRWEQCMGSLEGTLGTALSAMYVKNHFNQKSKMAALEMVDYIRDEFLRILDEIDWMDDETRAEAREKAKAISPYIGYPDELLQDELVEELYSGLALQRQNFYQNVRNLRIWSTNYAFGQLRKPNKRGEWKKHARAAVVNAYYNSLDNSIEFPAGILQGAFFDAERPNYMNFGAIGYVIGHEITHGFDDRGRQFDRHGNDRNWWKPKTDARFKERAQCIVDQYSNYTVNENGLKVNGINTQGENIADNGGIKEAYRAYRRWSKHNGREARLPGLAYEPEQLFWISAASIWCGKFRPEVLRLRVSSGVHSPAKFRIIGPLSNSAEFARAFNCPLGSPMNPRRKCSVW